MEASYRRARNPGFYIVQAITDFFEIDINDFRVAEDQEKELLEKAHRNKLVSGIALLAILYRMEYIEKNRSEVGKSQKT